VKQLLLLMLLSPTLAHPATIAFNDKIERQIVVLTDQPCPTMPRLKHAYMALVSASTQYGCWQQDDFMIHVYWDFGEIKSYPIKSFEFKSSKAKTVN
jgi:hypothetical protein